MHFLSNLDWPWIHSSITGWSSFLYWAVDVVMHCTSFYPILFWFMYVLFSTFNNEKIWAVFSNTQLNFCFVNTYHLIHHSPYIFAVYSSSICLFVFCVQLDRFASIRIPGSRKDRPPMSHFKHSASDWSISSSSTTNPFDELSSKITSEKEILALFEKMMVHIINTLRIVFELNISFFEHK